MAAKKTPAKKTLTKKTPTKKTPAKKTPAKKTPAKKTPAKRTPTKKTPTKKTPAKKSPAKKTPTKKKAAAATAVRSGARAPAAIAPPSRRDLALGIFDVHSASLHGLSGQHAVLLFRDLLWAEACCVACPGSRPLHWTWHRVVGGRWPGSRRRRAPRVGWGSAPDPGVGGMAPVSDAGRGGSWIVERGRTCSGRLRRAVLDVVGALVAVAAWPRCGASGKGGGPPTRSRRAP